MYREENYQRSQHAGTALLSAAGLIGAGAGLMYLLDPSRGAARRNIVRGKFTHGFHEAGTGLRKTAQYSRDRARGVWAQTRAAFQHEAVSDEQLSARVRSAIGRAVSNPSAIRVQAVSGCVLLTGPVLSEEHDDLISAVNRVRGVEEVKDLLEIHATRGDIPSLQGGKRRAQRSELMQINWSPTTRLGIGAVGGALGFAAVARRDPIGILLGLAGIPLLARALTNLPMKRLIGVGAGRRAVDVQKTISINAPIDQVFAFFSDYQNFPMFMSNVREVRDHPSGRSHWVVAGPAGVNVEWDADLSDYVLNNIIAWRSVPGSVVENSGVMRFDENPDGSTRVDIKLSYNPPGGAIGHAIAKLFGADPKSEMDGDLARVKTTLETCNPPHDAAQPLSQEGAMR